MAKDSNSADLKQAIEKLTAVLEEQSKKSNNLKEDIKSLQEDEEGSSSFDTRLIENLKRRDPILGALVGGMTNMMKQRAASKAAANPNQAGKVTSVTRATPTAEVISNDKRVAPEDSEETPASSKVATSLDKTLTKFSKSMDKTMSRFSKSLDKILTRTGKSRTTSGGKSSGPGSISEELRNASRPKSSISSMNLRNLRRETKPTPEIPSGRVGDIASRAEGLGAGAEGAAAAEGLAATEGAAATGLGGLVRGAGAAEGLAATGAAAEGALALMAAGGALAVGGALIPESATGRGYGRQPGNRPVEPLNNVPGIMSPGQRPPGGVGAGTAPDNRLISGMPEVSAPGVGTTGAGPTPSSTAPISPTTAPMAPLSSVGASGGFDMNSYLASTALIESGGRANARAGTSSASGMFQFTQGTWEDTVRQMGKDWSAQDRFDPQKSAEAAAFLTNQNKGIIEKRIGREATATDLYAGHFLGAGGASKFITGMQQDPNQSAVDLVGEKAAAANKNIFYDKDTGQPRTAREVYDLLNKKVTTAQSQVAAGVDARGKALPESITALAAGGQGAEMRTASIAPAEPPKSGERIDQTSSQVASGDQAAMASQIAMAASAGNRGGGAGGPTIINAGGGGGGSTESPTIAPNPASRGSLDQYSVFNPYNDTI